MVQDTIDGTNETKLPRPDLSIIIPARDEEGTLPATLTCLFESLAELSLQGDVIVVDDGSQDRTAEIAAVKGARVVSVCLHNIGAVRNAGAEVARAGRLLFLDADTLMPAATLQAIWKEFEAGTVGGGAHVAFDDGIRWWQRLLASLFTWWWQRWNGWAAGCCVYATKEAFDAIGGFDPKYFAAEERYISEALRTHGRFRIVRESVITSGRKLRIYSTGKLLRIAGRVLLGNTKMFRQRDGLEILYDAPRERTGEDASTPGPTANMT